MNIVMKLNTNTDKKGIAVAGNMIVDKIYPIIGLPQLGELTTIKEGMTNASGGAVCNVIVDLAKLDSSLPLKALGRVGDDEEGNLLLGAMIKHDNIDVSQVIRDGKTSVTIVMADEMTKQRTFFQYRGANSKFCEQDIDFNKLDMDILHVGYILLLDALDEADEQYGTKMARLLHKAQEYGIRTSIDVVTETGDRFQKIVPPALKYTHYCVINEMEAQSTTGIQLRSKSNTLLTSNIPKALKRMKELGVSTWAIIHSPEGGFGLDENNEYAQVPSVPLSKSEIAGTVGAGDAFCAGVLYAAWRGMSIAQALELANGAAACTLTSSGATEGMRSMDEVLQFSMKYRTQ